MFETRADIRSFLARVAREVRAGTIEVHAFAIVTNHFHMLVRSLTGEVSKAMHRIEFPYVRRFNRERGRDGPLVRTRFFSRTVETLAYRRVLVRYIDRHGVGPGRAETPFDYPHGSAHALVRNSPSWLETSWIESELEDTSPENIRASYEREFNWRSDLSELVEARLRSDRPDALDDLVGAAPSDLRRWFEERAKLADGQRAGLPVVPSAVIQDEVAKAESSQGSWHLPSDHRRPNAWRVLETALLRELAGLSWIQIGQRVRCSHVTARSRYRLHHDWLEKVPAYAERAGLLAHEWIAEVHEGHKSARPPLVLTSRV